MRLCDQSDVVGLIYCGSIRSLWLRFVDLHRIGKEMDLQLIGVLNCLVDLLFKSRVNGSWLTTAAAVSQVWRSKGCCISKSRHRQERLM